MEQSIYATIIKRYRAEAGLSQKEIANILGVKQATVSRIESGIVLPSDRLATKIKQLPVKQIQAEELASKKINLNQSIKTSSLGSINASSISIPYGERSGDYFSIEKNVGEKHLLMLADTVGHGINASRMAFAIEFGYKTILSTINSELISPGLIQKIIKEAILGTAKDWLGPPALITGMLDSKQGSIDLVNSGQPTPLIFSNSEVNELELAPLLEQTRSTTRDHTSTRVSTSLKPGSALLLYTDGFLELFGDGIALENLKERFFRAAKAFKGDSRATLFNLLTGLKLMKDSEIDTKDLRDDVTAVLITRVRETK